jgi:hypothetical protein
MILLILVGLYAIARKRVRITHSFQFTGSRANNFGVALIIEALPARLFVKYLVLPFLPPAILSDRLLLSFVNVAFLAVLLFGTAWYFRDRAERPV